MTKPELADATAAFADTVVIALNDLVKMIDRIDERLHAIDLRLTYLEHVVSGPDADTDVVR